MTKYTLIFLLFASTLPAMEKNFDYFFENENTLQPAGGERQFIFENPAAIKRKKVYRKRKPRAKEKPIIPDNYMSDFPLEAGNTINTGKLDKMKIHYVLNDD